MTTIDGSYQVSIDRTAWGDITLTLAAHDLVISLDAAEADRVCEEVWSALGRRVDDRKRNSDAA